VSRQKIAEDPRTPELLRVYAAGCNLIESAARVGMGRDRAREILEDAGILRHSLPWPAARVEQLRRLRASGLRWAEIGRELCVPADRAAKAHRQYVQGLPRDGKPAKGRNDSRPPVTHTVIGAATACPEELALRVAREVERLGAVVLLRRRGQLVTALPGSSVASTAERERSVIATYVEGVTPEWIADDLRESETCRAGS